MGVGFSKFDNYLYFKAVDSEYNNSNRVSSPLFASIHNFFSHFGLTKHTLKQKDHRGKTFYLNYKESVEWISKNDPLSDKAVLQKMHWKKLSSKFEEILKKKMDDYHNTLGKNALEGHSSAMYKLGVYYQKGLGVQKSEETSVEWFKKAILAGNRKVIGKLAKNPNLLKQVESGNGEIQYQIGLQSSSIEFAHSQYRKAADSGHAEAQAVLGRIYYFGIHCDTPGSDYERAYMWSKKAAKQGNGFGYYTIGNMYEQGLKLEKNMEKAIRCYRKAAVLGDIDGAFKLGIMFQNGKNLPQNHQEAFKYFKIASAKGHGESAFLVAEYLRTGKEISAPPNLEEAVLYYVVAANKGFTPASAKLRELDSEIANHIKF